MVGFGQRGFGADDHKTGTFGLAATLPADASWLALAGAVRSLWLRLGRRDGWDRQDTVSNLPLAVRRGERQNDGSGAHRGVGYGAGAGGHGAGVGIRGERGDSQGSSGRRMRTHFWSAVLRARGMGRAVLMCNTGTSDGGGGGDDGNGSGVGDDEAIARRGRGLRGVSVG